MKRKNNLYNNICNISNIKLCYNEVYKNTRNIKRVWYMKSYRSVCISEIYQILTNKTYKVGPYIHFVIYEPKKREIVSQGVQDKIVNHLVARYIIYPAVLPCLLDINVASRKNMGTSKGLEIAKAYHNICNKKYGIYYVLKADVSKFFSSIDHEILKKKLLKRIKDKDSLKIIFDIIDSNDTGLFIRFNDKSNTSYLLFKRFRSLYKRSVKDQILR